MDEWLRKKHKIKYDKKRKKYKKYGKYGKMR